MRPPAAPLIVPGRRSTLPTVPKPATAIPPPPAPLLFASCCSCLTARSTRRATCSWICFATGSETSPVPRTFSRNCAKRPLKRIASLTARLPSDLFTAPSPKSRHSVAETSAISEASERTREEAARWLAIFKFKFPSKAFSSAYVQYSSVVSVQ